MYRQIGLLFISIAITTVFSCKDEVGNKVDGEKSKEVVTVDFVANKKETESFAQDQKENSNSLMSRLIDIPELRWFTRYIVIANLKDELSKSEDHLIIFAPSNETIEALSLERRKFFLDKKNSTETKSILQSHIIKSVLNHESLLKAIRKEGEVKLQTVEGIVLTATEFNGKITIFTEKGVKAVVLKSATPASNGQIFIIDGILKLP